MLNSVQPKQLYLQDNVQLVLQWWKKYDEIQKWKEEKRMIVKLSIALEEYSGIV